MSGQPLSLEVALTGRDLLSPLLQKAQQSVDQFSKQVTAAGGSLTQTGTHASTTGKAVQAAGQQMEQAATSAGGAFTRLGQSAAGGLGIPLSIAAATAAVVAFGTSSVQHFTEVDKQIRGVNSLFGLTGEASQKSFESMSKDVQQFAVRMGVDAVGAAKSLYDIVSSGVTEPAQAMKVLEVATRAAIGGMTDAQTAGNGLTSVLNAYHLSADQATRVSDQMFQTVNLGKVTFGELSGEIGKVAPIAAAAGIGFDQVGAAIATMTKQGISAGSATTDLVQIINQFNKPSVEAAAAAKYLGIQFNAQSLQGHDLVTVLNEVVKATNGDKEALSLLFGSVEAVNGVLALTGQQAQGAASDLDSIRGSAGAADKAFVELNQSTARQFEAMGAKVGFFKDNLARDLLPTIKDVITFVDLVGQSLGAWPKDVPPPEQTENMRGLAKAAEDTARVIKLVGDAYTYLDDHIKTSRQVANEQDAGKTLRETVVGYAAAVKASAEFQRRVAELNNEVAVGAISQDDYTNRLDALTKLFGTAGGAAKDYRTEQQKLDNAHQDGLLNAAEYAEATKQLQQAQADQAKNEAMGNQGKVDTLGLVQQQIDAVRDQAAAERKATADKAAAVAAEKQSEGERQASIRDRIKAQQEAEAAAERAANKAIADAKRWAEQVSEANERGTKSYRKLEDDIRDIVDDGNGRLQDIRDRHDTAYNQAIIDAQRDQATIFRDGADDRLHIEEDAAQRIAEVQSRLNDIQTNADEAAVDHRLQASRRAADQELQDAQRAADRRLAIDRQAEDRRIAERERADDRARERAAAAADREQAIRDAAAEKQGIETGAGAGGAEREKAKAKDVADAKKQYDRDVARENADYRDALADDNEGKNTARINREHLQALARLRERFDDDTTKRDERYADEETKAQAQLERDLARAEVAATKRLKDLAAQEAEQQATEERQDKRDEEHRKLADTRARTDLETADRRDQIARNTREAREKDDWERQRQRAADALKADLQDINDKKDKDITASQEREAAAINASNDTLIEKQRQIDDQRDKDFGKFSEDLAKRFRELGQQFGTAMGDLVKMIPAKVDWFISGGATQIAQASALLNSGTQPGSSGGPSGGATLREGGKPGETQAEVDAFNRNAAKANEDNIRRAAGLGADGGAADVEPPVPGIDVFGQIVADLGVTLGGINQRFGQALIGGDSREAAGAQPPAVALPPAGPASKSAESAIAWMGQLIGSRAYDGFCERFVENSFGTSGRYPSAWAAAQALMSSPGGMLQDAPRGNIVFFRPDPSNGGFGHVGVSLGGGQFRSATSNGVTDAGATRYWSSLYAGYGAPRFADGGTVPGPLGSPQSVVAHGGETVLNPKEREVVRDLIGPAGAGTPFDYDRMAQAMARAVAAELRDVALHVDVADIYTGLLRRKQRNGSLGLN